MKEKSYVPAYSSLKVQWYPNGNPIAPNEVVGMSVVRRSDGYAHRAYCSDGTVYTFPRDLGTFLDAVDERLYFVDGVDRELEPILKYLGEDVCSALLDGHTVSLGGIGVTYRAGGSLSVRKSGGRSMRRIWSLKPFYPSTMLPEDDDCYGVQARGERLVRAMIESGLPMKLTSCGAVLGGMGRMPFHSCPPDVAEIACNAYHGGWIEAMKLGSFDRAYDYDLSSAYPTEAAKLWDCGPKCGSWFHTKQVIQEAIYGFCYCTVRMDIGLPFSPIMMRTRARMTASGRYPVRAVRNPVGDWLGWLTIDEVRFIVKNWLGRVEIIDGYWFVPTRFRRPYSEVIGYLNQVRRHFEKKGDKLGRNIGKVTAASLQGKLIQSFLNRGVRVTGNAFNPVYAATITSRVRLKVAEIALENYDDILMIMVDGILSTKPLAVPKQWKLEHEGECIVANHGDYDIPGRDTALRLRETLEERKSYLDYPLRAPRYVSLVEALEGRSFHVAGWRRPEVLARVSRVGKRGWDALPKVCADLLTNQYESRPLLSSQRGLVGEEDAFARL